MIVTSSVLIVNILSMLPSMGIKLGILIILVMQIVLLKLLMCSSRNISSFLQTDRLKVAKNSLTTTTLTMRQIRLTASVGLPDALDDLTDYNLNKLSLNKILFSYYIILQKT